jgi:protein disulfide-isomerase
MEERLFEANFVEGKNIDDVHVLLDLAQDLGMRTVGLDVTLLSDKHDAEIQTDLQLAQQFGVRGVPFFVFDRKYAVSGAQATETFLKTMQQVWSE